MVRAAGLLALLAVLSGAFVSRADTRADARKIGEQALALFEEKKFAEAYDKFGEADALFHAPTNVLYMARASAELRQLLQARRHYQAILDEPLARDAPPQFVSAREAAEKELVALDARIPRVAVVIRGAPARVVTLRIDGEVQRPDAPPTLLEPGTHELRAEAKGFRGARETITLPEGSGVTSVELRLTKPVQNRARFEMQPIYWPAGLAFAVGAAGVVVGGVSAAVSLATIEDVRSRCFEGHCPPGDEELGKRAGTLADLATAAFVVGGVGTAVGVFLAIFPPQEKVRVHLQGIAVSF